MSYNYKIMRQMAGSEAENVFFAAEKRLLELHSRTKRRLFEDMPPQQSKDFRILLRGCEAGLRVLYELPVIMDRIDEIDSQG